MAVSMRRSTIVNLKQVNELPLRNALESFDKNGDGKIDISELQRMLHWYGLWKHASYGLCLVIMILVWSTFGLTIWAINLTKDYTVTNGVLTGGDEVVKMSVASTYIPLNWATLLDRRHLDALDSLTIDVKQGSGKFSAGIYHMKVGSYLHANSTYLKVYGKDGSRVWVNSGTVVLYHPSADEAVMVCGASACNTLAVDVTPEYLQQLVQRSVSLLDSNTDFQLPTTVDGVAINKAEGQGETCQAFKLSVSLFNQDSNKDSVSAPVNPQLFSFEVHSQLEGETDDVEINIALINDPMVGRSSFVTKFHEGQDVVAETPFGMLDNGGRWKEEMDVAMTEAHEGTTEDIKTMIVEGKRDYKLQKSSDWDMALKLFNAMDKTEIQLGGEGGHLNEEEKAIAQAKYRQLAESLAKAAVEKDNEGLWK